MSRRPRFAVPDLAERLGHRFRRPDLLDRALTHPSAVPLQGRRTHTYQRLEFLGDRVLGLGVASMLFETFPDADEGELSRRLNRLVRQETCAAVALSLDVGPHLKLGQSEAQNGGRQKTAILADVAEALIGAIFLDGGWRAASAAVRRHWAGYLSAPGAPLRDAKTALQEWAQARGLPPPVYREVDRLGPDHSPEFLVSLEIEGTAGTEGRGGSKRAAEQAAAEAMLRNVGLWTENVERDEAADRAAG